jgi:hypothetical protein
VNAGPETAVKTLSFPCFPAGIIVFKIDAENNAPSRAKTPKTMQISRDFRTFVTVRCRAACAAAERSEIGQESMSISLAELARSRREIRSRIQ